MKQWFYGWIFMILFSPMSSASVTPQILLFEYDQWQMETGEDWPFFVHYSDGLTIFFMKKNNEGAAYFSVQLSANEQRALWEQLSVLDASESAYTISDGSHVPVTELRYSNPDNPVEVAVIRKIIIGHWFDIDNNEHAMPKTVKQFYKKLRHYQHLSAQPWLPEAFEVTLWSNTAVPAKPAPLWLSQWLTPASALTPRWDGDVRYVLKGSLWPKFKRFLLSWPEDKAILVNNQSWSISHRLYFPHTQSINK